MEKTTETTVTLTREEVQDIIAEWLNERIEGVTFKSAKVTFSCQRDGEDLLSAQAVSP